MCKIKSKTFLYNYKIDTFAQQLIKKNITSSLTPSASLDRIILAFRNPDDAYCLVCRYKKSGIKTLH